MKTWSRGEIGRGRVGPKGQVVIPAKLRKKLGIVPGTEVIISGNNGKIEIEPITGPSIKAFVDSLFTRSEKEQIIKGFWEYKERERLAEKKKSR